MTFISAWSEWCWRCCWGVCELSELTKAPLAVSTNIAHWARMNSEEEVKITCQGHWQVVWKEHWSQHVVFLQGDKSGPLQPCISELVFLCVVIVSDVTQIMLSDWDHQRQDYRCVKEEETSHILSMINDAMIDEEVSVPAWAQGTFNLKSSLSCCQSQCHQDVQQS